MRLTVHSVAGKMPTWVDSAVGEYTKRLPRELKLAWRDVPLAKRGGSVGKGGSKNALTQTASLRDSEAVALLKGVAPSDHCVALDGQGKRWSTEDLAEQLRHWMMQGKPLSLLIGGPDGHAKSTLEAAHQHWSLGPLTLPHPLVRVVLAEQIYRAWTITVGHPYHRA